MLRCCRFSVVKMRCEFSQPATPRSIYTDPNSVISKLNPCNETLKSKRSISTASYGSASALRHSFPTKTAIDTTDLPILAPFLYC